MCGIVGIIEPSSGQRGELLRRMCAAIEHRGPDARGVFEDERVALGMQRLSIIDVAHGQQPVYNESGTVVVVFNGELYNFELLARELRQRGHTLASSSDSEVIPHLYEEYGDDFVEHLRGMFAIAIWDRERKRLILVRDRLGKKPLYYKNDAQGFAFASEMKALLTDPRTSRDVDEVALSHYLTYQYVPAPYSALSAIKKLEPGCLAVFEDGDVSSRRYWTLKYADADVVDGRTEAELAEELRNKLLEAVRMRLVSERPLGAFLSGGLDSSAIVAAMSRLSQEKVKTFSIGFEDENYNELPFAKRVAELYGTDHHELIVHPDVGKILPQIARSFDEPYADSSAIPSYYLAEMARANVVVALNGDGGDEALGGYTRYERYLRATPRPLPPFVSSALMHAGRTLAPMGSRSRVLRKAATAATLLAESEPARRYARFLSYFRPEEKKDLLTADFFGRVADKDSYAIVEGLWNRHLRTDAVNRLLAVDTNSYLPGDLLAKVDITTMSVSLEARSPLLDQQFVEWAANVPGHWKIRDHTTKYLFKKALEPWLPNDLIHRKKMGFGIPLGDWLRGPLWPMLNDLLTDDVARGRGWFRPETVDKQLSQHQAGQDNSARLYALLMLELWKREVLDRPAERL